MANGEKVFEIIGIILPILSTIASWFNGKERSTRQAGESLPMMAKGVGAVLNVGALNFDKAIELAKAVKAALPRKDESKADSQGE